MLQRTVTAAGDFHRLRTTHTNKPHGKRTGLGVHHPAKIAAVVAEALRALAPWSPALLCIAPVALAQVPELMQLSTNIPAQPLADALSALARQTGLHLVYVSGVVRNQRSHPVAAGLTVEAALSQLLEGTGLRFERLTAGSVRILTAQPATAPGTWNTASDESYEVVITANRREESFQDVPIAIQSLSGADLDQLGVSTFNDTLKYTTNVTYSGNGPGSGNIFIRGLGSVQGGNQEQSTTAPFPSVALYLDDQSMQFPSRNNDVAMVDLERVEVLEGPQGTLLGGGAEAGAIRYVTNKPKLDALSGELNAGYGTTAGGAPNTLLNGTLNLPLIDSQLAVRLMVFYERRGGYIANVPATIAFPPGSVGASGGNPSASNATLVGPDTNPVTYGGLRLSLLYQFADQWNLLIQQNVQSMEADGSFYAYPADASGAALRPYQITAFTPSYTKDRYESTAWTVNGALGNLKVVYTGSYLLRHIQAQQDYSNYLRSQHGSYYSCIGPGAGYFNSSNFPALKNKPLQCYPPAGDWYDAVRHEHQSHELRVSTSESYRLRALFGASWEKFVIDDDMNFNYLTIPQCNPANLAVALAGGAQCLSAVGPLPGNYASNPDLRLNMGNAFGDDDQRGYRQYALFVSADLDLVPKVLTLSAGTRRYHYDEFENGSEWYSETTSPLILDHPNGACTAPGVCGFPINLAQSESGFASRANLSWHITPELMAYYTFSQGFRPGSFNRTPSLAGQTPKGIGKAPYCGASSTDPECLTGSLSGFSNTRQYVEPLGVDSDTMTSNELGVKSDWLNERLHLNAAAYYLRWSDVQWTLYDPPYFDQSFFNVNGPSYLIKGLELQVAARLGEGLSLQGSSAWNSSNQTSAPCLLSAGITRATPHNPTPAGTCITVVSGLPYTSPWATLDTSPPYSPPLMFNARVRYDFVSGSYRPFAWIGASHIATMSNAPAGFPDGTSNFPPSTFLRYTIPAYTTYDGGLGVVRDAWTAQLTGSNLSNVYAATNINSGQFVKSEIPLRPRVLMAQLSYRF